MVLNGNYPDEEAVETPHWDWEPDANITIA